MNFEGKENFYDRHCYFFQTYSFKFEGLDPFLQKKFENIVTQLSGTVSNDALHTLCEELHYEKNENKNRTDLYSINFILDSIIAKEPLDIEKYRFMPTKLQQLENPCCLISRYVLRANSCLSYYYDNVRCKKCSIISNDYPNIEHDIINIDEEELPRASNVQGKINSVPTSPLPIERKQEAEIIQMKRKLKECPEKNENEKGSAVKKRQRRVVFVNKEWRLLPCDDNPDINSNSDNDVQDISKSIEQENAVNNIDANSETQLNWWTCLPPPNQSKTVIETMYEKGQRRRGYDYTLNEQKKMIAYLILRNKVCVCKSRNPWRQMHAEGYMNNRSVESLSNHFRKVILPNISRFGLPKEIAIKFK